MRLDLHRHLEGSHSAAALASTAQMFNIRQPLFMDATQQRFLTPRELAPRLVVGGADDAGAFYACIENARRAYVSVAAIGHLAGQAFADASAEADGVDMRFSLFSMTRTLLGAKWRDVTPLGFAKQAGAVLETVVAARDRVQRQRGVPMLLRLGLSRTFESEDHYMAMADMAVEHAASLCGLDVLGIVRGADTEPLQDGLRRVIDRLRKRLGDLTIHAGEFAGHDSVNRALGLEPQALGHGVHAVQSVPVMAQLAQTGVTLEVCPTSNALLIRTALDQLKAQWSGQHPLRVLQRHHVHCVLGSDDPVPMGTSFTREWAAAEGLDVDMTRLQEDMGRRWQQVAGTPFRRPQPS